MCIRDSLYLYGKFIYFQFIVVYLTDNFLQPFHRLGISLFFLGAFNIIKKTQTVSHPLKSDWEVYTKYGYFPTDLIKAESVSSTLESVYDDYAAADMARRMGKDKSSKKVLNIR